MEENSGLEEGEASYSRDDGEEVNQSNNIDPDIDLSYIDEKIQNVLGHFQKDFEGGVSAEILGSKFGGYGSFLPTYERSPYGWSRAKTPQRSSGTQRFLPSKQAASQSVKLAPTEPQSASLRTATHSANLLRDVAGASADVSVKHESGLSAALVSQRSAEQSIKAGNVTDQRTFKLRIKVGSDSRALKTAAIYSGLGLDSSPSSSGNSPKGNGGILLASRGIADESPTSIIQVMTTLPLPRGSLISPLHESLLGLILNERVSRDSELVLPIKDSQGHLPSLVDEPVFDDLKEKGESKECVNFQNDTTFPIKKRFENNIQEGKGILSKSWNGKPSSYTAYVGDSIESRYEVPEVSMEDKEDLVGHRRLPSDLCKESSYESMSSHHSDRCEERNAESRQVEEVLENRSLNCNKNISVKFGGDIRSKKNKKSVPLKAYSDASKCKEDLNAAGFLATSELKTGKKDTLNVQKESPVSCGKEKQLSEAKKIQDPKISENEPVRINVLAAHKDTTSASSGVSIHRNKMHKPKIKKDINEVSDGDTHSLNIKLSKRKVQKGLVERPSGDFPKNSRVEDLQIEKNAFFEKSGEIYIGERVDNQPLSRVSVEGAVNAAENVCAPEVGPAIVDPVIVQEDWVCCENCDKWRLLPLGTNAQQLPDKWVCSMLNWLPGMNHCDISEDETTKALHALYQIPVPSGLNNQQNHTVGIAPGVTSALIQHPDSNHQKLGPLIVPSRGKKKNGVKGMAEAGGSNGHIQKSKSTKSSLQENVKSRSLNDMNQLPAESLPMNKSSTQHLSRSLDMVAEKQTLKQKEEHIAPGEKQKKMKSKRKDDHYGHVTSKKTKTQGIYHVDEHLQSDINFGKMVLNSKTVVSTTVSGKNMPESDNVKLDGKERLRVCVKKPGTRSHVSLDGRSLDTKAGDEMDSFPKKRKLKEWQENHKMHDCNTDESGLKKPKNSRDLQSVVKECSTSGANDKVNKKGRVTQVLLSSSKSQPVDDMQEARNVYKAQQHQKIGRTFGSQQTLDGVNSSRKDFGSGQLSLTATSSSSKVSDPLKTRAMFDDMKGSPVESVSSSPLRTSVPERLIPEGGGSQMKSHARNDSPSFIGKARRFCNGEGHTWVKGSLTADQEKFCGGSLSEPVHFSSLQYQDDEASPKTGEKVQPSSNLSKCDAKVMEHLQGHSKFFATRHCRANTRVDNGHHEAVLFPQRSGKVSSLRLKDNNKSSSDLEGDKMMVPNRVDEEGDMGSKKSQRDKSEIDQKSHTALHKRMNNVKHSVPNESITKSSNHEKDHVSGSGSARQCSKDLKMENPKKLEEPASSDVKLGKFCSTKFLAMPQQNLAQNFKCESKVGPAQVDSITGTQRGLPHLEGECKQESPSHQSEPLDQHKGGFDRLPIHASGNGVVSDALRVTGNDGIKSGAHESSENFLSNVKGDGVCNARIPGRGNSSSQATDDTLKEATKLKNYADNLKESGFGFESNEAYFQAALKFLHGASLLETCASDGHKQGDMTQTQIYGTVAKLCEFCALEYERRREMAAAALAYKCMEVAYWRVVSCKNSSFSKDRSELHASLQTVIQGESPSSSASDVDNFNTQATLDKANFSKGTVTHAAGNPIPVARNQSNLFRLLDFTLGVSFAIEASRKSQNAFLAANVDLKDSQNEECIAPVRRVIDFSFQDIEGFISLVQLAMEAIVRSGLAGARV